MEKDLDKVVKFSQKASFYSIRFFVKEAKEELKKQDPNKTYTVKELLEELRVIEADITKQIKEVR